MSKRTMLVRVFLPVAVVASVVHWWRNDWVIYDTINGERFAMIKIDWWIQIPVSAMVGCFFGAVAVVLVWLIRRVRSLLVGASTSDGS